MKQTHIHIVSRYHMRWIEPLSDALSKDGCRVTAATTPKPGDNYDLILFAWADDTARDYINNHPKGSTKYIVMVRAYEYVENWCYEINWGLVDDVICVNDYIAEAVTDLVKRKPYVIYNSVDVSKWKYKVRSHGNKIAMLAHIHYKKNHALALQILNHLPPEYELHCAGDIQCYDIVNYLGVVSHAMKRRVVVYGELKKDEVDKWLDDKHYILSTSMREGCPNNILEAMAKGIMPVVHNWPGARMQFKDHVFNTIDEAVRLFSSPYDSGSYRRMVESTFGQANYAAMREVVQAVLGK